MLLYIICCYISTELLLSRAVIGYSYALPGGQFLRSPMKTRLNLIIFMVQIQGFVYSCTD